MADVAGMAAVLTPRIPIRLEPLTTVGARELIEGVTGACFWVGMPEGPPMLATAK